MYVFRVFLYKTHFVISNRFYVYKNVSFREHERLLVCVSESYADPWSVLVLVLVLVFVFASFTILVVGNFDTNLFVVQRVYKCVIVCVPYCKC